MDEWVEVVLIVDGVVRPRLSLCENGGVVGGGTPLRGAVKYILR